jgi:hypothetical protein
MRRHDDPTVHLDLGDEARDEDSREVIDGSPRVALEIEPPFDQYVFIETDERRLAELKELEAQYEGRRTIAVRSGDCNTYLTTKLPTALASNRRWRAVVFLDPFGMQVPWSTVKRLADTRQVEEAGVRKRSEAGERLLNWYRGRLRSAFGHVSTARLITNSRGGYLYNLVFAGPNRTAAKIASYILGFSMALSSDQPSPLHPATERGPGAARLRASPFVAPRPARSNLAARHGRTAAERPAIRAAAPTSRVESPATTKEVSEAESHTGGGLRWSAACARAHRSDQPGTVPGLRSW